MQIDGKKLAQEGLVREQLLADFLRLGCASMTKEALKRGFAKHVVKSLKRHGEKNWRRGQKTSCVGGALASYAASLVCPPANMVENQ
jgi:hypothetical protein